jgi:hypothetical protein
MALRAVGRITRRAERINFNLYQAAITLTYSVMTGHRVQPETLVTLGPATWVTVFLLCSFFTARSGSKEGTASTDRRWRWCPAPHFVT